MENIFNKIGKPKGIRRIESNNAMNIDIITAIHRNYPEAVEQSKNVARSFIGSTRRRTAENVWNFLKKGIKYKRDPDGWQIIRLPQRFLNARTGDCKSYSLFAASVFAALGMPVKFRYAGYSGTIPSHVYVVTEDEQGREIVVDGTYHYFGVEKKPLFKKDYTMKVISLAGFDEIDESPLGSARSDRRKKKKEERKEKRKDKKEKRKEDRKTYGKGRKLKKALFAAGRIPFLGLVKVNFRGLATKLAKALEKNSSAVQNLWSKKLGGDFSQLTKTINEGKLKKRIMGIEGIGSAVAVGVAAAAPIIVFVADLLKSLGLNDKDMGSLETDANSALGEDGINPNDLKKENEGEYGETDFKPILIGGAAIAALIFFMRKKK